MDNQSIYELQKLDCNCNNCKFLERDLDRFNKSVEQHRKWQYDYFESIKGNLISKAQWWLEKKNDRVKHDALLKQATSMKFQFDKKDCTIQYGICLKKNCEISFIPNTIQLDTQECFVHRND